MYSHLKSDIKLFDIPTNKGLSYFSLLCKALIGIRARQLQICYIIKIFQVIFVDGLISY